MDVFDYIRGSFYTEYLKLALSLKIFDFLESEKQGLTIEQLASKISRPQKIVEALAEVLAAMSLLIKIENKYQLNEEHKHLFVSDSPNFVGPLMQQNEIDSELFCKAAGAFLSSKAQPEIKEEVKTLTPEELRKLADIKINDGEFLSSVAMQSGEELATLKKFSEHSVAMDIGGNDGSFLIPILKANPHLKGIVADLPHLKERAIKRAVEAGVRERFDFCEVNFFKNDFPKADLIFCGYVLHDWSRSVGYYILEKIKDALVKGGKLILHENLLDDPNKRLVNWGFHLQFLIRGGNGGIFHTSKEYGQWLSDTGFKVEQVIFGRQKSFIFSEKKL